MHTFSCFTFDEGHETPGLLFVVTENLQRAREVARRELIKSTDHVDIEIFEGNKLLWAGTHEQM
jgi:hypothetical protein